LLLQPVPCWALPLTSMAASKACRMKNGAPLKVLFASVVSRSAMAQSKKGWSWNLELRVAVANTLSAFHAMFADMANDPRAAPAPQGDDLGFIRSACVKVTCGDAVGTGYFVSIDGVVTCQHVVRQAKKDN
jgi:hypothetical protein